MGGFGERLRPHRNRDTVAAPSGRSGIRRLYRQRIRPAGREVLVAARRALPVPRMRPGFLIIGAKKAGTTSLYYYLTQHPRIVSALNKEIGFFGEHRDRSVGWYRGHFPIARRAREAQGWLTGEATPYYLMHPLAPERAARYVPDARLIALVRDPVFRAYSHYQHSVDRGHETLSFEEALREEDARLERAVAAGGGEASPEAIQAYRVHAYRGLGIYEPYLRRWLQHFPREQLLVGETEELQDRFEDTLAGIARFLGVEPWVPTSRPHLNVRRYPSIPEHVDSELRAFYRPHNARLCELLGREFRWAA